jgi:hypothetical protein
MIATARAFAGLYAVGAVLLVGEAGLTPYAALHASLDAIPDAILHKLTRESAAQWRQGPAREWTPEPIPERRERAPRVARVTTSASVNLAGTYVGRAPANDAAKRVYSLILTADGKALWNTFYLGKDRATQPAHWRQTDSELVLSFDAVGPGPPPGPITFHYHHHELKPIHWNQSEWGSAGPPVLHRRQDRPAVANSTMAC